LTKYTAKRTTNLPTLVAKAVHSLAPSAGEKLTDYFCSPMIQGAEASTALAHVTDVCQQCRKRRQCKYSLARKKTKQYFFQFQFGLFFF